MTINIFNRWVSLSILSLLGILLGTLIFIAWDKPPIPVEPVAWSNSTRWITAPEPSYRLYARHRFTLPDVPEVAWLRLSADNDYILYVNGKIVAQEVSTPRNTAGFAAKRSELYQGINDSTPYRWNIPDWVQISHARDWKLTTYLDLTYYLQPGENVIAIEVQDSHETARFVLEGAVYSILGQAPISLTTGNVPWQLATQGPNRQQFFWFEPDFPDYDWIESLGTIPVTETTYSRVRERIFQRPLQGSWITANEEPTGELWLRCDWQIPDHFQRGFLRFAGDEKYGITLNGHLLKHYHNGDGNQLHLYEVTNLLHPGSNTIAVNLSHFWDADWSRQQEQTLSPDGLLRFYLDGWAETSVSDPVIAPIQTDDTWTSLPKPLKDWVTGAGQGIPVTLLRSPEPSVFYRTYEGDAYLLNYPDGLRHLMGWISLTTAMVLFGSWGLGRFTQSTSQFNLHHSSISSIFALPIVFFLIGIGLLKHRYAEAEAGIWFAHAHTNKILIVSSIIIGLFTGLSVLWRRHDIGSRLIWVGVGFVGILGFSLVTLPINLFQGILGFTVIIVTGILAVGIGAMGKSLTSISQDHGSFIPRITWRIRTVKAISYQGLRKLLSNWSQNHFSWLLYVILAIGLFLRLNHLGYDNPEPDENVSWDAVRGILKTGAPIASSGIWYTRSPVYHYLLAIWLRILGDSLVNARLFSVVVGIATLILVFYFTRYLTGNILLALLVTAILAIDPWELWYSRNIRFYQLAQFFTTATFWAFLEGFITKRDRTCQHLFFIFLTLTLLSQEVTLLLLPGFFILFLFHYKPLKLLEDWPIFVSSFITMMIFAFNIYFVKIKSLTPLIGLSSYTTSFIKLQFNNMSVFATNFFVGVNRMYVIYSFLFFIGFIYFLFKPSKKINTLFLAIFINIAVITVMVFLKAARYTYPTYPIFILLSVYGAFRSVHDLGVRIDTLINKDGLWRKILTLSMVLFLSLNIEPIRVLMSYDESLRPRHMDASEFIQRQRRPGDVVISNVPAGHANTIGGADYYLMHRMSFFDAVYKHEGRVIDRWEGGVLLANSDQLKQVLESSNRVWIHTFDRQLPKDPELARFFNYLQSLGQPVFSTYGTRVKLWEKNTGTLQRIPDRGGNFGAY